MDSDPGTCLPTAVLTTASSAGRWSRLEEQLYLRVGHELRTEAELDRVLDRGEVSLPSSPPISAPSACCAGNVPHCWLPRTPPIRQLAGNAIGALQLLIDSALDHDLKGPLEPLRGEPVVELIIHRGYNPEIITQYNIVPDSWAWCSR